VVVGDAAEGGPRHGGGGVDARRETTSAAENEGVNAQKNNGMNPEHAYSQTNRPAYYFLFQIAYLTIAAGGNKEPAAAPGGTTGKANGGELFGALKNMARRL
jgi:hypothetical protein